MPTVKNGVPAAGVAAQGHTPAAAEPGLPQPPPSGHLPLAPVSQDVTWLADEGSDAAAPGRPCSCCGVNRLGTPCRGYWLCLQAHGSVTDSAPFAVGASRVHRGCLWTPGSAWVPLPSAPSYLLFLHSSWELHPRGPSPSTRLCGPVPVTPATTSLPRGTSCTCHCRKASFDC